MTASSNQQSNISNRTSYGPDNPHPLSQMKTELVWEGKYDEFGNRREVDIASCAMPMQRIETVDEPRQRDAAEGQTDMYPQKLMKIRERASYLRMPEFSGHETTAGA